MAEPGNCAGMSPGNKPTRYTVYRVVSSTLLHQQTISLCVESAQTYYVFLFKNNKKKNMSILNLPSEDACKRGENKISLNISVYTVFLDIQGI